MKLVVAMALAGWSGVVAADEAKTAEVLDCIKASPLKPTQIAQCVSAKWEQSLSDSRALQQASCDNRIARERGDATSKCSREAADAIANEQRLAGEMRVQELARCEARLAQQNSDVGGKCARDASEAAAKEQQALANRIKAAKEKQATAMGDFFDAFMLASQPDHSFEQWNYGVSHGCAVYKRKNEVVVYMCFADIAKANITSESGKTFLELICNRARPDNCISFVQGTAITYAGGLKSEIVASRATDVQSKAQRAADSFPLTP